MPSTVFVAFQLMFAIITVALISGAVADRLKFGAWLVFAGLWATFVYFPVAHWVFAFDGFTGETRWLDRQQAPGNRLRRWYRGAYQLRCGRPGAGDRARQAQGLAGTPLRPHNLPFVMLGAGLLWFGWYGFNAGSALSSGGTAGSTFITTTIATAAAMLAWLLTERIRDGHADDAGCGVGHRRRPGRHHAVLLVGQRARRAGDRLRRRCALRAGGRPEVQARLRRLARRGRRAHDRWSDGHPAGRPVRHPGSSGGVDGLFYGGGFDQLERQAVGAFAVLFYSVVVTTILALILKYTIGLRLGAEEEAAGIDEAEHAETGYDFATAGRSSVLGRSEA